MVNRIATFLTVCLMAVSIAGQANGQVEIKVKNDQLPDDLSSLPPVLLGQTATFNFGEEIITILTSPCDGFIVGIELVWCSANGFNGQTVEQSIA